MRLAIVLYGFLVAFGFWFIVFDKGWAVERAVYQTVRGIPKNHRIVAGDVEIAGPDKRMLSWSTSTPRDFEGRYATKRFDAHQPIDLAMTEATPVLHAPTNTFLYWIPADTIDPADARALDVNALVTVCGFDAAENRCFTRLQVAAVSCAAAQRCSAAVWIPYAKRSRLLTGLDAATQPRSTRRLRAFVSR